MSMQHQGGISRRKAPRLWTFSNLSITRNDATTAQALTLNISDTGVALCTSQRIEPGEEVILRHCEPWERDVRARALWSMEAGAGSGLYRTGLIITEEL